MKNHQAPSKSKSIKRILLKFFFICLISLVFILLIFKVHSNSTMITKTSRLVSKNNILLSKIQDLQSYYARKYKIAMDSIKVLRTNNELLNNQIITLDKNSSSHAIDIKRNYNNINKLDVNTISLTNYQPKQDQEIKKLSYKVASAAKNTHFNSSTQYKTTDLYHIYKIEKYGVILNDKFGNFTIAQINKPLSVGTIKEISRTRVIAGNYQIT